MKFPLYWTETALEHISTHGIHYTHVDQVLNSVSSYGRKHKQRMIVIGRSERGVLFIVVERSLRAPGSFEVVSCRLATSSERDLFLHRGKGAR